MNQRSLRTAEEIQLAHDLLADLTSAPELLDAITADPTDRACLASALNVLCWVLGHGENGAFVRNLATLKNRLVLLHAAFGDGPDGDRDKNGGREENGDEDEAPAAAAPKGKPAA